MYTLEDDHNSPPSNAQTKASKADALANTLIRQTAPPKRSGRLTTPEPDTSNSNMALAALTIACIGVFFTSLDQTVVVTALPQIITDLHIPITQLDHAAWIISAYLLGFIVAMPLMGRVSDIYGRRRIFLLCLAIFGLGSLLCALAPTLGQSLNPSFLSIFNIDTSSPGLVWLIAARLIQAIGGGAVVPVAMAIAGDFYGAGRRALALGIIGAVTEAGGAIGPLYGALVVQKFGWQAIFYLNIPVVILLILTAWFFIPVGKHLHEGIDWLGALLLALALTCLSLGLAQQGGALNATSLTPQNNPLALLLAATFLLAFILVEYKVRWPIVELASFKRLTFSSSSLVSLFVGAALIIAMTDIPIFVDTVLQRSVLDSGLALLRLTVLIPVGALLGGWLCDRISCRVTAILGLLSTATGFFLMSRWPIDVSLDQMTPATLAAGFGFGLVIAPISTTAINSVKNTQAGMASSIVTALRMVGMMLGLAALTSWALSYFGHFAATYPRPTMKMTGTEFTLWIKGYVTYLLHSEHTVYTTVFFISMFLCLIAIIPACFLWGRRLHTTVNSEDLNPPLPAATLAPTTAKQTITLTADSLSTLPSIDADDDDNTLSTPSATNHADDTLSPHPIADDADDLIIAPITYANNTTNNTQKISHPPHPLLFRIASLCLLALILASTILAVFTFINRSANTPVVAHTLQLALDKAALTSIFTSQLGTQQSGLSDLSVAPAPNDGLLITLNLHIDVGDLHRILPVELDGTIAINAQQDLQITIQHVKRDGVDAGPLAVTSMQTAINQLVSSSVTPALHHQLKGVKLLSAHTSSSLPCNKGTEMLLLQVDAPLLAQIASPSNPTPFCFTGPLDLSAMLSQ